MKIPDSTRSSLTLRLITRQRERWPQLKNLAVRFRNNFAYVDGVLPDGEQIPLCRLRYGGYASEWALPSISAAATSTRIPSFPAAHRSVSPARPSTAPAASTSEIPQLGVTPWATNFRR